MNMFKIQTLVRIEHSLSTEVANRVNECCNFNNALVTSIFVFCFWWYYEFVKGTILMKHVCKLLDTYSLKIFSLN